MKKNLLVMLKDEDHESRALKRFYYSLPGETSLILNSFGYIGGLNSNISKFAKKDKRRFLILEAEDFNGVENEYFAKTPQSALFEIDDKLRIKFFLKQIDTDICRGGSLEWDYKSSIENIVQTYKEFAKMQPKDLLVKLVNNIKDKPSFMFKKTLFRRQLKLRRPSFVYGGIETLDAQYLLSAFGDGPFYNSGIYSIFGY